MWHNEDTRFEWVLPTGRFVMFGHIPEVLAVLLIGLLVFGPKRVIEMGSQLGKVVRELRQSTKDLSWSSLLSTDDSAGHTPPSSTNHPSQSYSAVPTGTDSSSSVTEATIVDGTVTRDADEPS
jgi:TatA/E family protein of Tat protein translocase